MRWFIIVKGPDVGPWVLAETPDEAWAKDEAWSWRDRAVLNEMEAMLDPNYAAALEAWRSGDDSAHGAKIARLPPTPQPQSRS